MDENVPVHVSSQAGAGRGAANQAHRKSKKFGLKAVILSLFVVIVIVVSVLVGLLWSQSTMGANIDTSKYQAVFFTNGQVYFGKLQTLNGDYMKMTDIFYLQAKTSSSNPQATTQDTSDVQLIKLGNEIHGPDDQMIISKSQILFFENLKSDGKVTASINKYLKK